jgi:hypothetical protein
MMLLRCFTSSESDDGSCECSGGLYRPERSMVMLRLEPGSPDSARLSPSAAASEGGGGGGGGGEGEDVGAEE